MKNFNKESKIFAFKLAEKTKSNTKWRVRSGVSIAGCSGPDARGPDIYRGRDSGVLC